jgi:hypothetical protein
MKNKYILKKIENMIDSIKSEELINLYKNFRDLNSDTAKWIIK